MTELLAIPGEKRRSIEPRPPFTRERLHEIEPSLRADLIKGILPRQGVAFIGGPSTSGKTFFALELGLRTCRGEPVNGHRSKQAGVLYIAAEDAEGVRRRVSAWRSRYGPHGAFQMIPEAPDVREPESLSALEREIEAAAYEMDADNVTLGLIVIDTWSKAAAGADQNSSADMGAAMSNTAAIATKFNCLVLVIAHTPKDEARGIAGWYGQFGGADGVIMLTRDLEDEDLRLASVTKMKNGPDGRKLAFRLDPIEIGLNEDDEPVTSCVVAFEDAPSGVKKLRTPKLGPAKTVALKALSYIIDHGDTEPAPSVPGVRSGTRAANREAVRERAFASGFSEDGVSRNTRNVRWNRAIEKLVAAERVRIGGELIWPV